MKLIDKIIGEEKLLEKGKKCLRNNEYDEAISYFNRVLTISDNDSARYNKGIAFIKQRDYKSARIQFKKLLEKHPKSKQILEAMAFASEKEHEYEEADVCYIKILELKKYSDDLSILDKREKLLDVLIEYMSEYGRADKKQIKEKATEIVDCCNKILNITSNIEPFKKDDKINKIEKDANIIKEKYINNLANS